MLEFAGFDRDGTYDELIGPKGRPRAVARQLMRTLNGFSADELENRQQALEHAIRSMGITFTVYSEADGSIDRNWPLDLIPRIIERGEWTRLANGLTQRLRALNAFIDDVYHDRRIIEDGVVPAELIDKSPNFRELCIGVSPPGGIWAHICGSDIVRDGRGDLFVLEDNLRVPSGVSYLLENREVMKRALPELFDDYRILPVDGYPAQLNAMLRSVAPEGIDDPEIVVLTPGQFNSAYFEHCYLAQQLGCELVIGNDLIVSRDHRVFMKTTQGLAPVHVIYRRIDDLFLDPEVFHPESMLGVPGLMEAWRRGNVSLVNAPGAGVADDKAVYLYVPEMIRYYLGEEPEVRNVPSYRCEVAEDRAYVLDNLESLVVKPTNESGGYGLMVGRQSTRKERQECARAIEKDPARFIAQPTLELSSVPTLADGIVEPRHVDLRPFILAGRDEYTCTTGGLTRVALRKGSLIVNSSQGGGSKDTWVVDLED